MPQEQFHRVQQKSKSQSREVQKKIEILQSQLAQETMRSGIRRMKLEKTFEEHGTLSQAVVRNLNEAARDPEAMEMADAEHRRGDGDQQSEISFA